MNRILLSALILSLTGCAEAGIYPSLNPRPIEAKAEGLLAEPAAPDVNLAPATAETRSKIDGALRLAQGGVAAFDAALPRARSAADAARSNRSFLLKFSSIFTVEIAAFRKLTNLIGLRSTPVLVAFLITELINCC